MTQPSYDLLQDPIIHTSLRGESEIQRRTLPEIFGLLTETDRITSFSHLQAHQSQAWFCFLCQLAAIALTRDELDSLSDVDGRWADLLLGVTEGETDPWHLVVSDLAAAAFFQPPVPEGSLDALGSRHEHPDDLDLLVTSKNHDVKLAKMADPAADHWIFALVSLQTMEGFGGRGNYGIARMNKGYSCRPFVGLAPGLGWGERFRRDVAVLLGAREGIVDRFGYDGEEGTALTYLRPWDGTDSLELSELDPYFLEVCRRVRLVETGDGMVASRTTTKTQRVAAKELKGNLGDPWVPVERADQKALHVSGSGFTYRLVSELILTGEYELGPAGEIQPTDPDELLLVAQALSRGQGQTNGLHERIVPIPRHVRRRLVQEEGRQQLAERAEQRIEIVGRVQKSALRPALCALFQGDPLDLDFTDERPRPWVRELDARVDRVFFPRLWEHAELAAEEADLAWRREVLTLAEGILNEAADRASVPEAQRYRGWAGAERRFQGTRKRLLGAETVTGGSTG